MKVKNGIITILIVSMILSTIPNTSHGEEISKAKVISTVGDGLRYYIEYEVFGQRYRSDEVGTSFNANV